MKKLLRALFAMLPLLMTSCSNNDEPKPVAEFRLSWIGTDGVYELFEYNTAGLVSSWKNVSESPNAECTYSASFSYPAGSDEIIIKAEEDHGSEIRNFDEKLRLNPDGTAAGAEGSVRIDFLNGSLMMKIYTKEFHYDAMRRLTAVNISERRTDNAGWVEENPLEWTAELEWAGDHMTRYTEYINPAYPLVSKKFTYYGGVSAEYRPIVQGCIVHSFYLPLAYQGVLGRQSVGLVKSMTMSDLSGEYHPVEYTYDIATSLTGSRVEQYTRTRDGRSTAFAVAWEEK